MSSPTPRDAAASTGFDASVLLDSIDDAVVAVDASDRIVTWNQAAERLLGIPSADALGASRALIEPEDDPAGWTQGVLDGRPKRFVAKRVGRGGIAVDVDVAASPVVDGLGRIAGIVQVLRPAMSEDRRPLLEMAEVLARVGHWRIELPDDRHTWSDEVYRVHGLEPGAPPLSSEQVLALYHPDDRDRVAEAVRSAIVDGSVLAYEARVWWPGGMERRVVCRGTTERGPDGRATAVVGVIQDLTEQAARDAALAERDRSLGILREAIDVVRDSISVYDEQDRFVLANRKFFELYPYLGSEARLRGKTFEEVLRISIEHNVFMDSRALYDTEGYVAARLSDRSNGRPLPERRLWDGRWYLVRENRTPSGYAISTRVDITERKEVEVELAATTSVLQATLDTMPNALVAFDAENHLVAWNSAFAELIGLEAGQLARGRLLFGVAREALRQAPAVSASLKTMVRHLAGRGVVDFEWTREDGEIFAVLGRPMANGGHLTLFRNVTAERQAQARATQIEQRLSDALEAMSEGFALFDADDVLILCNETYRTMYGESSPFIRPGRRFEDMVRDSLGAGQFPEAVGREEAWLAERLAQHRNPPDQPVLQHLADGRVLMVAEYRTREGGSVGIRADITERVRTENELRAARDALEEQARSLRDLAGQIDAARQRAEEAGAARSRFLAMMSHELRTPMTGLLGMIELLSRTGLDGEQREFVGTMRDSAETLLALLNDILDFSKLEAGKVQLEEIVFAPQAVVRDIVGLFQAQASTKGLVLDMRVAPSVPAWVRGDPLRVKQILSNLISNAIKFTMVGRISVGLRAAEAPEGRVRLVGEVVDTGQGIDPEVQRNLFQAFEQGDTSMTRRFGGTGLGLAISRRLAEGMGGAIAVESAPGEGSTFWFTVLVQLATAPADVSPEIPDVDSGPVPPMRILLAEDNDVNRMLVSKVLAQSGHRVDEVEDGREALRAVVRNEYDLILMDMQMPVMDGMEATRAIRTLPGDEAAVPIVALTADALPEHRQIYLDSGVDELLTKPVDWRQLNRILARFGRGGGDGDDAPRAPATPAPVATRLDHLPVFDPVRIEEGLGVLPPKRVAGMLAMLPSEVRRRLDEFRAALDADDLTAAHRAAHTLKGLAANFGAARLEAASRSAEAACGTVAAARAAVPMVEDAVECTAAATADLVETFTARG